MPDLVLARAPMRLSFLGGGSDLPLFTDAGGAGCILSATIGCHAYVMVRRRHDKRLVVHYREVEQVSDLAELDNDYVREALRSLKIRRGLEIISMADISVDGAGLGGSSAFLVALLAALHALSGEHLSPETLAEAAFALEAGVLGKQIGRQDHYASALGGFNQLDFLGPKGGISIRPRGSLCEYEDCLLLIDTQRQHNGSAVFKDVHREENRERNLKLYGILADLARKGGDYVGKGQTERMFAMMADAWIAKRGTSEHISNKKIDGMMAEVLAAGATAGKVCGSGGGGCILFWCPDGKAAVLDQLSLKYQEVQFSFVDRGVEILLEA